jgi:membrane-bound lytic murein transglycosylase B
MRVLLPLRGRIGYAWSIMHRFIPAIAAAVLLLSALPATADLDFNTWLQGLRRDALQQGITPATLDLAFAGVQPIPRIIDLDRQQPETTLSFNDYIERVVTPVRRDTARRRYAENRALLDAIGQRYGVQPRFILALWGIESDFGRVTGGYPVVAALATLAYDGRRSAFFRHELLNALVIIDRDHIDPTHMTGSWAGAMGQSQFMPTSFLNYAVSYRGDGPPDIWQKQEDVFASIANYLATVGWHGDENWGEVVSLPKGFDPGLIGLDKNKSLTEWATLGIRAANGAALARGDQPASLIQPGGAEGPNLLVSNNFRVVMHWNSSTFFATAVGFLADSVN